jgi:WD40 repeat protein
VASGQQVHAFTPPSNPSVVIFSPDGKDLLVGSRDNIVRLWDIASGKVIQQYVGHTNIVWYVVFSPDGKYVLTGSQDKTARLWDTQTGQQIRVFPSHNFTAVSQVAYSPDGKYVLIGSSDGTGQLADVQLDTLIHSVCSRLLRDFTDDERTIYSIQDKNPTCPQAATQPAVTATP